MLVVPREILCLTPDADDPNAVVATLRDAVEDADVKSVADADSLLELLDPGRTAAVVVGYDVPGADDGLELLETVRERVPDVVCVLFATVDPDAISAPGDQTVVDFVDASRENALTTLGTVVETAVRHRTHTSYPVPSGEDERLDAVETYVSEDERLQEALGRLLEVATRQFDAEYAYVGLMHQSHQEHLTCVGFGPTTLEREDTICTYTLYADEVTVIEDVPGDPRFSSEEYVGEMGLQWYVGAPIRPDGEHAIGTLCLLGTDRRAFSAEERRTVELYAEQAADLFYLARRRREEGFASEGEERTGEP